MKTLRKLLVEADPLRYEPILPSSRLEFCRRTVLSAVPGAPAPHPTLWWSRTTVVATLALAVIAALFGIPRMHLLFVSDVHAAVRFEVKLAEDKPAPGLQRAKVSDSNESVYLYERTIVTNEDIATARIVSGSGPSRHSVSVQFKESGTEKMRAATKGHIGKRVAILIDGQVVAAPVIRTPISDSAIITGKFTKAQADRIVNGIGIQ